LSNYIEFICSRRMNNVNLKSPYSVKSNPLPWTQKWISGAEVQVAPQETEITSYVSGGTKQDVDKETFKGFSL
jgi:ribonucleotide reductase beta subunit family protein with ferritin-like domain